MILWILDKINAASSAIMKIKDEMTCKQQTKNKMADSDCGLRHHYLFNLRLPIAKCVQFSFMCDCQNFCLALYSERSAEKRNTNFAKIGNHLHNHLHMKQGKNSSLRKKQF